MSDEALTRTRARVNRLPDEVWNCERCGGDDTMSLRRSSLNPQFYADDVALKCMRCWYFTKHGIPFEDPDEFEHELEELRNGTRTLDVAEDGPADSVKENLEALGYVGRAELE